MKPNLPLVSVVVTTRNRPRLFAKALKSVQTQTYPRLEIIVVDDASRPGVQSQVIRSFNPPVKYLRNTRNRGLAYSRNLGLKHSRGKYAAFLDDDDTWEPQKIALQVELARKSPNVAVISCAQTVFKTSGQVYINHPVVQGRIKEAIVSGRFGTVPSSNLFSRSALIQVGGFDIRLTSHIDYDIWMKLAQLGLSADYLDQPLVNTHDRGLPRMTADYTSRLAATDRYLSKWTPVWQSWIGVTATRIYLRRYYTYVVGWLAEEQFKRGKIGKGMTCLALIIRRYPTNITGLFIIPARCLALFCLRWIYLTFPVPRRFRLFTV
ncbi:hypothetical protein A3H89_05175 [Candidatus Amesbacteria bacterium RIFCSPLOWO2_02_FULL_48_11]|uniref:Glycosyltransferase 2-like domain-containing protein n=5 Tax=Candidatus Amesiibacteriota TaxID=1752730 RepID=A0A1F4ZE39_9BACT|nr:MAG: Glycosyltransferase [Candidatus Amesbacteria bacterium GW2011_GWA2_47_11]KKU94981.1 MAG: Glycosyltransferase [Candidatus Amesbacteria bacterium GW2011_GWC1_48_10]KKW01128.1 MAG: Glycosyltransferase [Candidatus Amesbacteria bacterium GW2011_GWA1_48_9]OGC95449.1 MAG: hypothetical protein A3C34_03405 [Candidatus Amesbacteria bacterium RIFCSPHIGHO2_02_FULL_48_21]OGC97577.1 MAG: hypothetical protein A2W16_02905 [Candidatus Amesbacteria bacterium RBG_16_48_31]OGC98889.1 MAG: hypothetical pro